MAIKIDSNMSAVAHHVINGAVEFPYAIDAHSAAARHPEEWSLTPWSTDGAAAGRKFIKERHARETEEAKARAEAAKVGAPAPLPFDDEEFELTPEEQEAIDEHARAVAEANERLKAFREKKVAEKAEADQVARDEALVKSPAPRPDPAVKRPFGRKGELTPAERKMIKDKEQEDRIASSNAKFTG